MRRCLTDPSCRPEHAASGLLQVIGDGVPFCKATTEHQCCGQQMHGGKTGLAAFLWARIQLLGVNEPTTVIGLIGVGEEIAFGTRRWGQRGRWWTRTTATIGLACDQARALVAAADADRGPQALRTAAVIRLLLHNALRVDEACAADVRHRVLRVTRKGARRAKVPLAPATVAALDAYLADRARCCGLGDARQLDGPAAGHRQRRPPPPGPPVGTGAPPGPRRGHRGLGSTVPALPAALATELPAALLARLLSASLSPGSEPPPETGPPTRPTTAAASTARQTSMTVPNPVLHERHSEGCNI